MKKPKKRISQTSDNRAELLAEYKPLRDAFLAENPVCGCHGKIEGCTYEATAVHHKIGRESVRLIMVKFFLSVCQNCHDWIGEHSDRWDLVSIGVTGR